MRMGSCAKPALPSLCAGDTASGRLARVIQLFRERPVQAYRAVQVLGGAARTAAAGTGAGAGTGAAAGAGTVPSAAEAASAKAAAPAATAEAASAAGRAGPRLGAHAAGTGLAVRPGGVPEVVDEHIAGAEAAGIAVAPAAHHHHDADDDEQDHQTTEKRLQIQIVVVIAVVIVVPAVVRRVVGAVVGGQGGGPVGVAHPDVHPVAVVQVGGGDGQSIRHRHTVRAGNCPLGEVAGQTGGVVPRQGHGPHLRLVEPAGGVIIEHRAAVQSVHILLHPAVGEGERLALVVGAVQIDVHVAVVEGQALDIVGEGRLLPDGAVGHADLQLLPVGQLLQRRPRQGDGDGQAAVVSVGQHVHVVAVDIVVVRPGGDGAAQRRQHRQQQDMQFLQHVAASSLLPVRSWQM